MHFPCCVASSPRYDVLLNLFLIIRSGPFTAGLAIAVLVLPVSLSEPVDPVGLILGSCFASYMSLPRWVGWIHFRQFHSAPRA